MDFFSMLILGHLTGDFLLQNKWMAMNKQGSTWKCGVHCLIYTLSVVSFTWVYIKNIWWVPIVFLSHFIVDRWALADKWLELIDSRSLKDFIRFGKCYIPMEFDRENYHALRAGFTALVYTIADNTIHILLMVAGYAILRGI